jgi:hypothetical protein
MDYLNVVSLVCFTVISCYCVPKYVTGFRSGLEDLYAARYKTAFPAIVRGLMATMLLALVTTGFANVVDWIFANQVATHIACNLPRGILIGYQIATVLIVARLTFRSLMR